ncbi:MAG: DUF3352 domain-containing protein [Candidatus Limnocylindrales bacterium]
MTDQPLRPDGDPATETSLSETTAPETPVATTPVAPPPAAEGVRSAGRTRWFAALGVVALVVVGSVFAALVLTGASPTATVTGYVPADSVMYGEVRLDLPGDQRAQIGEFLAKFPGFADQAALDTKLDEVLDRLLSDGTDGKQTFTRDIKPWFDGELAFSVGALPTSGDAADAAAQTRALILVSVKDEAIARAWFSGVIADTGVQSTTEDYAGVALTVFDDLERTGSTLDAGFAIVGGKVAIAGDLTSVKAAIDTKGAGGLADDPEVKAAQAAAGDHIGFMFVDLRSLLDSALALSGSVASAPPMSDALLGLVPDWASFRLRVEGDALLMDGVMPHVADAPGPDTNRANGISEWAPATTLMLAAGNDYGASLLETVALYRQDPSLAEVITGVDQAAGIVGGLDAALSWMGDSGLVIAQGATAPEGGIVAIPTDAAKARQLFTTLRSFATLGGGQAGITVRDETYAGATITIIDLGSAQDLMGMAGALGGGMLPTDPSTMPLPTGNIEIAYTVTDDVVVLGSGPAFVKSVLDAGAGSSLADDGRFKGLVDRVGATHTGVSFVDIAAIRGLVEGLLSEATAAERAEYEESVKPFLVPFDAFVAATVTGDDLDAQHAIITVK